MTLVRAHETGLQLYSRVLSSTKYLVVEALYPGTVNIDRAAFQKNARNHMPNTENKGSRIMARQLNLVCDLLVFGPVLVFLIPVNSILHLVLIY